MCVKSVRIRSYSGPYFPAFGLITERYGVCLRIQSKCGKIRTRITPNTDTLNAVLVLEILIFYIARFLRIVFSQKTIWRLLLVCWKEYLFFVFHSLFILYYCQYCGHCDSVISNLSVIIKQTVVIKGSINVQIFIWN